MLDSTSLPVSPIVYHVPLSQLPAYRGRSLIVRSARPRELVARLVPEDLANLAYVQLCSLPRDINGLIHWAEDLAIELLLDDPAEDFPRLYHYAKLLDNHPVRVALPVTMGFEKAAKLASSLQFAVRLQIGQPAAELLDPLARLLDDYLHGPTVAQPIEYFHSLLLSFCHEEPISLWVVQEEDPALVRYVDERGEERLPGKLAKADIGSDPAGFVERWVNTLLVEGADCSECPFFEPCRGYFKWPRRDYDCAGVKTLFRTLQQAADELWCDLAAVPPL
ncbi:MAG: hypothetical protein U9Q81_01290 [Pseudomonadota bacterium]|nr:hypothetical protein [Pseudomonadota bacterium]